MTTQRAGTRRRRFKASKPTQNIVLTDRDKLILEGLDRYRFLSSNQIVRLVGGSRQKVLRRLRLLFDHGYVDRPRAQIASIVFGNTPMIYGLGDKGVKHLRATDGKFRRREQNNACTNFFINHAVETAEFFICLETSVHAYPGITLLRQSDILNDTKNKLTKPSWPVRFNWPVSGRLKVNVTPDGMFGLVQSNQKPVYFFVEVDRGTEPVVRTSPRQSSILKKMLAYKVTHERKASGLPNFRALIVTTSEARTRAMIAAAPSGVPSSLLLFATQDKLTANSALHIWTNMAGHSVSLDNSWKGTTQSNQHTVIGARQE